MRIIACLGVPIVHSINYAAKAGTPVRWDPAYTYCKYVKPFNGQANSIGHAPLHLPCDVVTAHLVRGSVC